MKLTIREMTIFSMLGAIMYASKMIMEVAPNIHLLGAFIVAFTVVYRKKALYPICFIEGGSTMSSSILQFSKHVSGSFSIPYGISIEDIF